MNDLPESLKGIVKGGGSLTALPIIETQALYEARRSGRIAYAAIDVVEPEPLPLSLIHI